jgi:hypothetical protein
MSVVSPIVKPFKLDTRFDDSDPKAKTSVNYMLEKLAIKKDTLHKYLPADKFKREDGYIHGVTLVKDKTSEDKLNDIDNDINEDHEAYAEFDDRVNEDEGDDLLADLLPYKQPEESLYQLKDTARVANNKVAEHFKNLGTVNAKPQKKESPPEWFKKSVWRKANGTSEKVQCPVCSLNQIAADSFHAGHILPESKGGMICSENIMPICGECNSQMGTRHLYWFAWHYYGKILWSIY